MLARVVKAKHLGAHRVWLSFSDGRSGTVDLCDDLWGEVFEPLKDVAYFSVFTVDDTLIWPNGADFAPEFLYEKIAGGEERENPNEEVER
jgi:hypothetical protein